MLANIYATFYRSYIPLPLLTFLNIFWSHNPQFHHHTTVLIDSHQENTMESMIATKSVSTFEGFGRLPCELRRDIWELHLPGTEDTLTKEFVNAMARHIIDFIHICEMSPSPPSRTTQNSQQTRYGQSRVTIYGLHEKTLSPYAKLAGCAESRNVALKQVFRMLCEHPGMQQAMSTPRKRRQFAQDKSLWEGSKTLFSAFFQSRNAPRNRREEWLKEGFARRLWLDRRIGGLLYVDRLLRKDVRLEELVFWDLESRLREEASAKEY